MVCEAVAPTWRKTGRLEREVSHVKRLRPLGVTNLGVLYTSYQVGESGVWTRAHGGYSVSTGAWEDR